MSKFPLASNKLSEEIITLLASSFPMTVREIEKALKNKGTDYSYKYIFKVVQELQDTNILIKKKLRYELNRKYILHLKLFSGLAAKNYKLNQNVFTDTMNSEVLNVFNTEEQEDLRAELMKVVDKRVLQKLAEWYAGYYDPEGNELKHILEVGKLKGKTVLELGCGTGRITFEIVKHAKHVTAIDKDVDYVKYCENIAKERRIKNLDVKGFDINNLSALKGQFDVIISGWAGLHYSEDVKGLVKSLYDRLKKGGTLIIIEAYPQSEYIDVLNLLRRKETDYILKKQKVLKDALFRTFGNMQEDLIPSYYRFPSFEKLEETFKIELHYEEGIVWTPKDTQKLKRFLKKKKDPLCIDEPPLFFICRK